VVHNSQVEFFATKTHALRWEQVILRPVSHREHCGRSLIEVSAWRGLFVRVM